MGDSIFSRLAVLVEEGRKMYPHSKYQVVLGNQF